MSIYRARAEDGIAWVTGGATGMGRALALDLVREGYVVAVTGREQDPTESLVDEAAALGGTVLSFPCDVSDQDGMERTVASIEEQAGPIVLAVFNAGTYLPTFGENLTVDIFRRTYEVNLFGVINGLVPVVERMKARSRGQIVIMGSVTALFGWPSTGAYGATKAALNNMAESLRYDFVKLNIRIQVINPGFVDTPLAAKNAFVMPALMPVASAAARMTKAIRSGGFETTFPHRFTWSMKFLRMLPRSFVICFIEYVTRWRGRPPIPGLQLSDGPSQAAIEAAARRKRKQLGKSRKSALK